MRRENESTRVVLAEERDRPADDVVPPVEVRALELRHDPDPPARQLDDVLERRDSVLAQLGERTAAKRPAERRQPVEVEIVEDDEGAVGRGLHVELDEVGPQLDRPLERRERVLALVGGGAAMGDHPRHPTSDRTSSRSIASTMPSAAASRSSGSVPRTAMQRSPAPRAESTPASVSSNATDVLRPRGRHRAPRARGDSPRGRACRASRRRR